MYGKSEKKIFDALHPSTHPENAEMFSESPKTVRFYLCTVTKPVWAHHAKQFGGFSDRLFCIKFKNLNLELFNQKH